MKKILTILTIALLTASVWAQSPQKISYQSVVRDTNGALVSSATVGMQVSILQGAADGAAVYTETQTPDTNENGLISVEIGNGTTSDDFSTIDWANGPYFVKVEIDPAGGDSYSIEGVSEILSVPYALHSGTSASTTQAIADIQEILNNNDMGVIDLYSKYSGSITTSTECKFVIEPRDFTPTSYSWNLGDGTIITDTVAPKVYHTYAAQGVYDVTYSAKNSTISNSGVKYDHVRVSAEPLLVDADGNTYAVFTYGTQTWMAENLKCTTDTSGNPLPIVTDNTEWVSSDTAICYLNNDPATGMVLYNYQAAMMACPDGYHLPSVEEWATLIDWATNNGYTWDGSGDAGKVNKAFCSKTAWNGNSDIEGTPGGTKITDNNALGMTIHPSGYRSSNSGNFLGDWNTIKAGYATATPAKATQFYYKNPNVSQNTAYSLYSGMVVRCIKD